MPCKKMRTCSCPPVERLPDEILLYVFAIDGILSPLDHAHLAATCNRFRRLAEDSTLWRDVSLEPYRSFIDDFTVQILVQTRFAAAEPGVVRLQSIDFSKCSNITDVAVGLIARSCPGLIKLDLSECVKISDWSMAELGKRCPRLQDLSIKLCPDITDAGIGALVGDVNAQSICGDSYGRAVPLSPFSPGSAGSNGITFPAPSISLRRLDISWCDKLTDVALEHIGARCPDLRDLKMSFSGRGISDRGIHHVLGTASSDCREGDFDSMPPSHKSQGNGHPLRVLEAAMCPSITSLAVKALLDRAPHLNTLVITWCDGITSAAVNEFRRKRPSCSVQFNTAAIVL